MTCPTRGAGVSHRSPSRTLGQHAVRCSAASNTRQGGQGATADVALAPDASHAGWPNCACSCAAAARASIGQDDCHADASSRTAAATTGASSRQAHRSAYSCVSDGSARDISLAKSSTAGLFDPCHAANTNTALACMAATHGDSQETRGVPLNERQPWHTDGEARPTMPALPHVPRLGQGEG